MIIKEIVEIILFRNVKINVRRNSKKFFKGCFLGVERERGRERERFFVFFYKFCSVILWLNNLLLIVWWNKNKKDRNRLIEILERVNYNFKMYRYNYNRNEGCVF